jgi:c-di-GMP-binding flagellar brake protein YcgR
MADEKDVRAELVDVSLTGARLANEAPLPVGAVHDFAFDLEGARLIVRARVRHCHPAVSGPGYQLGVQFVRVDPQDERRLREYVAHKRRRRGRA